MKLKHIHLKLEYFPFGIGWIFAILKALFFQTLMYCGKMDECEVEDYVFGTFTTSVIIGFLTLVLPVSLLPLVNLIFRLL